jgi:hypothetical protein
MMTPGYDKTYFSFPRLPEAFTARYGIERLTLRPFGQGQRDLEVDFHQAFRPYLVTDLLQCCTEMEIGQKENTFPGAGFFWQLTVGKRLEALLTIVTREGAEDLTLQLRCLTENCGEPMEILLSREEILGLQPPGDDTEAFAIPVNGEEFFFRKPTGQDQKEWLNANFSDEKTAVESMIEGLWIREQGVREKQEKQLGDEWLETVNEGMKQMDPLVHFELAVNCPACNRLSSHVLDLEDLLLRKLHNLQTDLVQAIHCLASHYHWSEQQILAISPRRRGDYLALIEKDTKGIET